MLGCVCVCVFQLRACLGMQVVACIASFLNLLLTLDKVGYTPSICWHYSYENMTQEYGERCYNIEVIHMCSINNQPKR